MNRRVALGTVAAVALIVLGIAVATAGPLWADYLGLALLGFTLAFVVTHRVAS